MRLKHLRRAHRDYDAPMLERYRDLFVGGERFAKNVRKYLPQNDAEPPGVYAKRCAVARDEYINYSGGIGNFFASWLATSKLTFKSDPEDVDEFYEQFKENCDGDGAEFEHFMRHRFVDALIDGEAYWRVEYPEAPPEGSPPETLADWKANGRGRAALVHVPKESLVNWRCDRDGWIWVVEHSCEEFLDELGDDEPVTAETWTVWRRDGDHCRYQIEYDKHHKPNADDEIPEVELARTWGQVAGIPIVCLGLPPELWLMNLIAAPQMAHWRKQVGLSWAIDRTCYAMPVFNVKNRRKPPAMGSGYYLIQGVDERAGYLAPPAQTYDVVENYLKSLKDEIHRVVQQMARGVDNNAAAVGRSGMSKQSDDQQTEIVLSGFGQHIRDAAEETFDMVAEGRGEDIEFDVEGMSTFHVTDATTFVANAVASQQLNIPSPTYHREIAKRTAQGQLPDVSEDVRQQIADEIDENITEESVLQPQPDAEDEEGSPEPGAEGEEKSPTDKEPADGRQPRRSQ